VDGDLVACLTEHLKFMFELMVPVFRAAAGVIRYLVCPLPCYLWRGCCGNVDHAPNRADECFQEDMLGDMEKAKRVMRSLAFKHELKDMKVLNPGKLLVKNVYWNIDPVHPTVESYKEVINTVVSGLEARANSDVSAANSVESSGSKRVAGDFLVGPDRRPSWVSACGSGCGGQNWTSCSVPQWQRGHGGGWRRGRRMRRGY
jgi:hypothetical protein